MGNFGTNFSTRFSARFGTNFGTWTPRVVRFRHLVGGMEQWEPNVEIEPLEPRATRDFARCPGVFEPIINKATDFSPAISAAAKARYPGTT